MSIRTRNNVYCEGDEYANSGNRTIRNGNIEKRSFSIVSTVGPTNPVDLDEARAKMQSDMNINAKIAEEKRKEKEREKLKAKIEKYEKMGFLITGKTCGPSQTLVEHNNAMSTARCSMQHRLDETLHAEEILEKEKSERERLLAAQLEEERKKNQLLNIEIARMKMQEELIKSKTVVSNENQAKNLLGRMKIFRKKAEDPNCEQTKPELTEEERHEQSLQEMRIARSKMQEDLNNKLKNLETSKSEE